MQFLLSPKEKKKEKLAVKIWREREKKKYPSWICWNIEGLRKIGGGGGREGEEKWWSGQLAIVQLTREPPPLGENHLAVGPNGCISRPTKIRSRVRTRFQHRVEREKKKEKKNLLATPVSIHGTWRVERDPIKLISTVPILICCPEIIPFHRVNSLVPFDSRYTR